jgi:hypothetical protein
MTGVRVKNSGWFISGVLNISNLKFYGVISLSLQNYKL